MDIRIAKADRSVEIDFAALSPAAQEYVIRYGLTQSLNDATASVSKDESDMAGKAWAHAMKKLEAIKTGITVRAARVGDPVRAEAVRLALQHVIVPAWKKSGKTADAKAQRAEALALIDRNPAYMHLAESNIARDEASIQSLSIDVDLPTETEEAA